MDRLTKEGKQSMTLTKAQIEVILANMPMEYATPYLRTMVEGMLVDNRIPNEEKVTWVETLYPILVDEDKTTTLQVMLDFYHINYNNDLIACAMLFDRLMGLWTKDHQLVYGANRIARYNRMVESTSNHDHYRLSLLDHCKTLLLAIDQCRDNKPITDSPEEKQSRFQTILVMTIVALSYPFKYSLKALDQMPIEEFVTLLPMLKDKTWQTNSDLLPTLMEKLQESYLYASIDHPNLAQEWANDVKLLWDEYVKVYRKG